MKKFLRAPSGSRWAGGVCAGLAYMLGIPSWIIRLAYFLLTFAWGIGVPIYLLLWVFVPEWRKLPDDFAARTEP